MCEYKKGITDFSSALKLTSSDKQILLNRGANYYFIGEFDKSEKDLRKAIEISPDFAEAYNTLGILLMAQGNYADAIPVFEKSIKFAKSLEKAMPLRNISLSYIALGELPKAEKLIAEAKKIDPRNKFLFHVLGRYHYALGDFEKSLDFYNTAESASDIPGEFALEKSLALIRNGFFDEGLSYINLALSDDPNHLSLKDLLKELQSLSIMETSPRLADCISIIQEYISSN
jgi:tetratricopeptide (TPR) repeat protein